MQNSFFLFAMAIFAFATFCIGQTPVPTRCQELSASCGKCNTSPLNCRYVWTGQGCYNSSINGSCLPQEVVDQLLWYNEYNMTVYAYALKESEVATPRGQYLISRRDSYQTYGAYAVLCFDRHLCYCKPPAPAPPNRVVVNVYDCRSGLPLSGANVTLSGSNLTSTVGRTSNSSGGSEFYPLPSGSYFVSVTLSGYDGNSTNIGMLMYNESRTASLCLTERPCNLTVYTYDASTNRTLSGVSVSLNSNTFASQNTDANGMTQYSFYSNLASQVFGTLTGYTSASSTFTCTRNGTVTVYLYLSPILGTINVQVLDARTNQPIGTATVNLSGGASRTSGVDGSGRTVFTPLNPGAYFANATAPNYTPNGVTVGNLALNSTLNATIYLTELPCTVVVTVYDSSTSQTLVGASVSVNAANISALTTLADGLASFSFNYDAANAVTATKVGYTTNTTTFTCGRNRTVNLTIYLAPVLNVIIVQVLDARTNLPITSASVSISGTASLNSGVNGTAMAVFSSVAGGTYTATASASGYNSNSSDSFSVTYNQTVFRIIYLSEVPCTVNVVVYDLSTNLTLSGAVVSLNALNSSAVTTQGDGLATFKFNYDYASVVSATKTGYTTDSRNFQCARNTTLTYNLYIAPVLNVVIIQVLDARTNLPITSASVSLSGAASLSSGVNGTAMAVFSSVVGGTYTATASASGYNSNSSDSFSVSYNQTVFRIIYLSEVPCTVNVVVYDLSTNLTLSGAVVSLNALNSSAVTTQGDGLATFKFNYDYASVVSATKTGYTTDSRNFQCARNLTLTYNLYITPVLNQIYVQVLDIRTNQPIPTASVTLIGGASGNNTKSVNGTAWALFENVAGGSYSAGAFATGYYTNFTTVGTLSFNQTVYAVIYLGEIPCTLVVTVLDNSTNSALSGALVSLSNVSIAAQTTSGSPLTFVFFSNQASSVSANKTGYYSASSAFQCARNLTVPVTLVLVPVPSRVQVQVLDARDGRQITTASVTLNGGASALTQGVNGTAVADFYPIALGTYSATARASGYNENTTSVGSVSYNQTVFVIIYLSEQPCTLTVVTRDNSTGALLDGVLVALTGASTPSQTTTTSGTVSFSINFDAANVVTGTKTGFTSASSTFNCTRNGNLTVTLYLIPVPNTVAIQVRDIDDNSLITNATVSLYGGSFFRSSGVDANATAYYFQVPLGSYSANASATSYYPNSTTIGQLTYNQSVFVVIYLRKLPCIVTVNVVYLSSNLPVVGASVQFNGPFPVFTTDQNGQVVLKDKAEQANAVMASKAGYKNVSDVYRCFPGANINITLALDLYFEITVGAREAFNYNNFLRNAQIYLNGLQVTKQSTENPAWKVQEVVGFPITYTITAFAPGYSQETASRTFLANDTQYFITLAPVNFKLGFAVEQLYENGTSVPFTNEFISSGFVPEAGAIYQQNPGSLGGSAYRVGVAENSAVFRTQTFRNVSDFVAVFSNQVPTSQSPFYLEVRNISFLATNYNNTVGSSVLIFVPNYDQTEDRELKIPLPYRVNSGFMVVRVTPYDNTGNTRQAFGSTFAGVSIFLRSFTNYQSNPRVTGATSAVFEFLVPFGDHLNNLTVSYATEIFDASRSNFLRPSDGSLIVGNATSQIFDFDFPTADFLTQLFTVQPNGQWARKSGSKLYMVWDFKLFYRLRKRTSAKDEAK